MWVLGRPTPRAVSQTRSGSGSCTVGREIQSGLRKNYLEFVAKRRTFTYTWTMVARGPVSVQKRVVLALVAALSLFGCQLVGAISRSSTTTRTNRRASATTGSFDVRVNTSSP